VAISDYWTQVILEPIMVDVQSYTKERFANVSFSSAHEKGFINLKKFIRPGVKSYDISSWTDAFPAVLQLEFMKARYGDQIANCWYNLVVSCEWDVKGSQSTIKYNRGQGMGTNGSFDIATITDLFLLEMIYKEDYKRNISVTTYNKVGDDLWCYDPDGHILNTYTQICGIDINLSKTKSATKENLCGEFVSRNLNYGVDVSRISANICRAVKKNILDVPQLALHLSERDCEFTIPLRELFAINKIRSNKLQKDLVRTFYLLCKLYSRPGFKLLQKSVREEFPEIYYEDDFINIIKTFGVSSVEDSYNVFIIDALYKSIQAKTELVFDSASEFDSSEILSGRCEPELLWTNNEPIGLMTSKYILAKTFRSLNELYAYPEFKESSDVLSALEKTDQAMTFKELGVISTSGEVWRPRATKLFNFVKHLVVLELYTSISADDISPVDFSEGNRYLATTNVVSTNDPIYKGTNLNMIGHLTMSTNSSTVSDCSQWAKPNVSHIKVNEEAVSLNDSIY
jgi:hypothetical protein